MAHTLIFTEADGNGVETFYGDVPVPHAGDTATIGGSEWTVDRVHYEYPASDAAQDPSRVHVLVKKKTTGGRQAWFF